jgi:beta-phosphoglucomutase
MPTQSQLVVPQPLTAVIFDVDGVIVDTPHEQAWREALEGFTDPARFTPAVYQTYVAGKPRAAGAYSALSYLGVPDADRLAVVYAETKQRRLLELVNDGKFTAFPDALRFIQSVRSLGLQIAAASSSKNANAILGQLSLDGAESLLGIFTVNVCGRDLAKGKPDPEIFLLAAAELGAKPGNCLVVEDAPSGIKAAKAGDMKALGIARSEDPDLLANAGADLVVQDLDCVSIEGLAKGGLRRQTASGAGACGIS